MKVVVGIDLAEHWKAPVDLLRRIRFPDVSPTLIHAIEPLPMIGMYPEIVDQSAIAMVEKEREGCGHGALTEAHNALGMKCEEVLKPGSPVNLLIQEAEARHADMIAVGSGQKGAWGSLFFGSVGKGLLVGADQSILFGKNPVKPDGPVTAIFATDHSEYANRTMQWLLDHRPLGISHLIIFTAIDENAKNEKEVEKANHDLAIKFIQNGTAARGEVRRGHASAAIREAMAYHKSDLLILGAQGHGFFERLRIGSLSFEQVVNSPHSVLVIRP
jgi:nucleotide-binding universal stress UspA family protein